MSSTFDICPTCKKPMSGFDSLILLGSVWQHVDCARDSSGEMPAAVVAGVLEQTPEPTAK
jgi:hypothetical protein